MTHLSRYKPGLLHEGVCFMVLLAVVWPQNG